MLIEIIRHLVKDADVVIIGEPQTEADYQKNVIWRDERPQPSWQQIQDAASETAKFLDLKIAQRKRHEAFVNEADPLYFGWQRGENTEQAWLNKVAEIRARYPYPA